MLCRVFVWRIKISQKGERLIKDIISRINSFIDRRTFEEKSC